jgi:teichuronic acid biosynthesis glycosyltransferase TuaC
VNKVSCVLAVSQALAEKTFALCGRKPLVLPIGIDLKKYSQLPDRISARRLVGLPASKRVVLFVGNLLPNKGIGELMAALTALRSENILGCIVGDGPMRAMLQQSESIRLVGQLSNREVALYLAAANLFVLPSYSEGMPTVLVEAGAAGLPIVATRVGGIPDLLAEERGLLIPPGSSDAIVWGIRHILTNWEAAIERARRLRRFVQQKYDVDSNAEILARLYERLLNIRPVPGESAFGAEDSVRPLEDLISERSYQGRI